jgi:hypothetical protein
VPALITMAVTQEWRDPAVCCYRVQGTSGGLSSTGPKQLPWCAPSFMKLINRTNADRSIGNSMGIPSNSGNLETDRIQHRSFPIRFSQGYNIDK